MKVKAKRYELILGANRNSMIVDQFQLSGGHLTYSKRTITTPDEADFILIFTTRQNLEHPSWMRQIQDSYPDVKTISCSTSGEIYNNEVADNTISGVAVQMEGSTVSILDTKIHNYEGSREAGRALASKLDKKGLKYVFLASDGWEVNGTELIDGMYTVLSKEIAISGGLAADGVNFAKTMVGVNDDIASGNIVVIGFYGDRLKVGFGTHGGWDEYGQEMTLTKGEGRIVQELDGQPALQMYKQYLGEDAEGLPGTALWYPVSVSPKGQNENLVRNVHGIDELNQTLSLGEAAPKGSKIKFMKAVFDDFFTGVDNTAKTAVDMLSYEPDLTIVVSCIARKLLFGHSIGQEISSIEKHVGSQSGLIGFYSYGEVCPVTKAYGQLNHQMLTITALSEE